MMAVRAARKAAGVLPSYKRVDTCAAEFEANTPYMYSCYDGDTECAPTKVRGGGDSAVRGPRPVSPQRADGGGTGNKGKRRRATDSARGRGSNGTPRPPPSGGDSVWQKTRKKGEPARPTALLFPSMGAE